MSWSGSSITKLVVVTERERQEPILALLDQLRRLGYGVHTVSRLTNNYTNRVPTPSVVLLDLNPKDASGTAGIQSPWEYVPIIMLTRADDVAQIRFGAALHDFITLPTTPVELDARIRFALWKTQGSRAHGNDQLQYEDLRLNTTTYDVWVGSRHVELTFKEFELLKFFVAHRRQVFSRSELLDKVWASDYYGGTRTVDVHIRRLRAKLGVRAGDYIQTVRNVGYRFG